MRVVIVTESFPPDVNGVAHCALQTARHLAARGHRPARHRPGQSPAADGSDADRDPAPWSASPPCPCPATPRYGWPSPAAGVAAAITAHRADLVHLASPFVLGVRGMAAAARLGLPAVAVYQTDLAGYARTYLGAGEAAAWRRIRAVHSAADRTLAPSTAALRDLERARGARGCGCGRADQHPDHLPGTRAERHPDPDLGGPARHRRGDHAVEADRRKQQRDEAQHATVTATVVCRVIDRATWEAIVPAS